MSFVFRSFRVAFIVLATVGLTACGNGDASNEELGQGSPPIPGDSAVLSTTEPAQLNDSEIAGILAALDTAEIAPSERAADRGRSPEVTELAAMMVRAHEMLSDSLRAVTAASGITPSPSTMSEQLQMQTRATLQSLEGLNGAAFDSAYVAAMVQSHEAALNAIDSQLLPAAEHPQLRRAIDQQVRPTVAGHLQQIQQIQATLTPQ